MTLAQARRIFERSDVSFADQVEAASVITSSADASLDDVLKCMEFPGLPAELAAIELHRRTGRPLNGTGPGAFVVESKN